jgi:hypothetical protein
MGFPYLDLVEKALKLSPNIRFATVSNMLGEVKYSQHRKNASNLLTQRESLKSLESAARAWSIRNEFSSKIGKGEFVIAQYGKIARIVVPLDKDHLLYMTATKNADHIKIANKATKLKLGKIKKTPKSREKLFTP